MSVLVGREAPDFTVPVVLPNGKIQDDFNFKKETKNRYALLFFYPLDFTFVCPSELVALSKAMDEFTERDVEVISVSIDSQYTHNAWRHVSLDKGGIGHVKFIMASDVSHSICRSYGVEHPEKGVAFRAAILIDRAGIVRAEIINDLPLGRSIHEILRLVDALQYTEKHGEVCPVNWKKGEVGMKATHEGVSEYLAKHQSDK